VALGLGFFWWRRNEKRRSALGRLSLVGSDEKLPESGVSPHPPPEPWTYTGALFNFSVAMLSLMG